MCRRVVGPARCVTSLWRPIACRMQSNELWSRLKEWVALRLSFIRVPSGEQFYAQYAGFRHCPDLSLKTMMLALR